MHRPSRRALAALALVAGAGLPIAAPGSAGAVPTGPAAPTEVPWYQQQPEGPGPHLELLAPLDWEEARDPDLEVEVRVTDPDDLPLTVAVEVRLGEDTHPMPYDLLTGTHHTTIDLREVDSDNYSLLITARDLAGHYTSLSGDLLVQLRPHIELIGQYGSYVRGRMPVEVAVQDRQTPVEDLVVRVGAARQGSYPKELGDASEPLTYDPDSGHFVGTWDSTVIPDHAVYQLPSGPYGAWPFVVEVTDEHGMTATVDRMVAPRNRPYALIDRPGFEDPSVGVDQLTDVQIIARRADEVPTGIDVRWALDDGPLRLATPLPSSTDGRYRDRLDTSQLAEGQHRIRLVVRDVETGVTTETFSPFRVTHGPGPHVMVVSPFFRTEQSQGFVLEAEASKLDPGAPPPTVTWRLDAVGPTLPMESLGGGRYRADVDLRHVPNGSHDIHVILERPGRAPSTDYLVVSVRGADPAAAITGFLPTGPRRLLDTRPAYATGPVGGPRSAGKVVRLPIPDRAELGLASGGDAAVALSVTATDPLAEGWVTVWPCGSPQPLASNVNVTEPDQTVANLVLVRPGTAREVCVVTSSPMHVVVDLLGVVPDDGRFASVVPSRLLDTRTGGAAIPDAGSITPVQVAGRGGVPGSSATQVAINLTATAGRGPGWVTVVPCKGPQRTVSHLNVDRAGQTVANLAVAELDPDGRICLYSSAGTHLVVDVLGWWGVGGLFTTGGPERLLDTRLDAATRSNPPAAGSTVRIGTSGSALLGQVYDGDAWLDGIPARGVAGAIVNITVTGARGPGWVTVWACDEARPTTSNLNVLRAGQTVAASVATGLDDDGAFCAYLSGGGHLVADLEGWLPSTDPPAGTIVRAQAAAAPATPATVAQTSPFGLGSVDFDPLSPADDLFYIQPSGLPHTIVALDWSGAHLGTLVFEEHRDISGYASPDGSRLSIDYDRYDRLGQRLPVPAYWYWADDNRHTCEINRQPDKTWSEPNRLNVEDPSGRTIPIATLPQHDPTQGISLLSCSIRNDRAVVVMNNPPNRKVIVIRLSDGATMPSPAACPNVWQVSADGLRMLSSKGGDATATVCDVLTGEVVAVLPHWVGYLNGDGSLVMMTRIDHCGWYHERYILEVATGAELWSSREPGFAVPCNRSYSLERSHYAGPGFTLQLHTVNEPGVRIEAPVFLVGANGRPRQVWAKSEYARVF